MANAPCPTPPHSDRHIFSHAALTGVSVGRKDPFSPPSVVISLDFIPTRQMDARTREAEERFDEVNEELHHTIMKNRDLEKELEELVKKTIKGSHIKIEIPKEESPDNRGENEGDEHKQTKKPPKSTKKGETRFLHFYEENLTAPQIF